MQVEGFLACAQLPKTCVTADLERQCTHEGEHTEAHNEGYDHRTTAAALTALVNFGNHQDVVYGKEASNRDCKRFRVTCLLSPRFYWEDSGTKWNMEAKPSQAHGGGDEFI